MTHDDPYALAQQAAAALTSRLGVEHVDVALVLGSGWSTAAADLGDVIAEVQLGDLPGFSAPVVAGHGGAVRALRLPSGRVAALFTASTVGSDLCRRGLASRAEGSSSIRPVRAAHSKKVRAAAPRRATVERDSWREAISASHPRRVDSSISA